MHKGQVKLSTKKSAEMSDLIILNVGKNKQYYRLIKYSKQNPPLKANDWVLKLFTKKSIYLQMVEYKNIKVKCTAQHRRPNGNKLRRFTSRKPKYFAIKLALKYTSNTFKSCYKITTSNNVRRSDNYSIIVTALINCSVIRKQSI